ncbi:hypothetical protein, partial [Demequina sp.]|uniref:hypothetical protein n=1 Tax=Demequina sp. TaxID=2050685 RepID=UPI0025E84520
TAHTRVPSHTALTGLAALWIHCWRPLPPTRWHLVGERGLYRTTDTSLVFHSGVTARLGSRIGPVAVAPPARACLDALRWEPAEPALEAVVGAVLDGRIVPEALDAALELDSARGAGHARLTSLVAAVTALAGHRLEAPAAGQPGRLAPVMRRAS